MYFFSENAKMPNGWERCSLPDFTHIEMGQSPPSTTYNHDDLGMPFFQGKAEFTELYPRIDKYCSQPHKIAKAGATLLTVRAPVGPTNLAQVDCCIGRGLAGIHPLDDIEPKFILFLMRGIEHEISGKGTGSTFTAINKTFLEDLPFALPPLNEQKRILAKIEALFSELDNGIESLKTAREQLKVYRQAVLKHAFEGKMTEKWREENKDKLETADDLFERIKKVRQQDYDEQVEEWKATVGTWEANGKEGKKPSRPRAPKMLNPLSERGQLGDLPFGWCWDRLGWMTCGVEYGTSAKSSGSGDVPVLRMGNIQNARFDWSDLVYTSDEAEIAKYSLSSGDVLFNRTNSPELVGKTAIFRGERPAIFAGYLIRVNQNSTVVDSQYLNLFLNTHTAKQYGNQVKTDGVNQSNINGEKLQGYPFPYCSIDEQIEVVRVLDEKLSLIDQMEADILKELSVSSALRQSILKRAFSGQLVEQDPKDEPASELLARIKAEKEEQEKPKKVGKKKAKRKAKRKDAA